MTSMARFQALKCAGQLIEKLEFTACRIPDARSRMTVFRNHRRSAEPRSENCPRPCRGPTRLGRISGRLGQRAPGCSCLSKPPRVGPDDEAPDSRSITLSTPQPEPDSGGRHAPAPSGRPVGNQQDAAGRHQRCRGSARSGPRNRATARAEMIRFTRDSQSRH